MMRAWVWALLLAAGCTDTAEGHRAAASLMAKRGNLAGALGELRQAVHKDPRDGKARRQLGAALVEAQRYEEAERTLRAAVALDSQDGVARRYLAQVVIRRGRWAEGEALLREHLTRHPDGVDVRAALGALLAARGNRTAARDAFQAVLEDAPHHRAAVYGLARVQLALGDLPAAASSIETFAALTKGSAHAPYARALLAAHHGQSEQACAFLTDSFLRGLTDQRAVGGDAALAPLRRAPCFRALLGAEAP